MIIRKTVFGFALSAVLLFAAAAQAEETEPVTDTETEIETETEQAGIPLSNDWRSYQLQIGGEVYQFPMTYDAFTAYGWTLEEDHTSSLEPNQYASVPFEKDGVQCHAYVINFGISNREVSGCLIGGISIESDTWETDRGSVILPRGITRGTDTVSSITAVYGIPSNVYAGESCTKLVYETDLYCGIELTVPENSGVLENIDLRNLVMPEEFDAGEASDTVPEAVAAYRKPESLSDDISACEIEVGGEVYALPVPVSVLLADGWTLGTDNTDETVSAHYFGWAELRKEGQSILTTVVNTADYATTPENCWIEELSAGGLSSGFDGALPGGIRIGITEEALQAIIAETEVSCEVQTQERLYRHYTLHGEENENGTRATVYLGDDGSRPANTVIAVSQRGFAAKMRQ